MFRRKPSIADIYIKEVGDGLGEMLVPIFAPNSAGIAVGTIGRFTDGAFERRGHLAEILGDKKWARKVPMADPVAPGPVVFASKDGVSLKSSATVSPAGQDLVKAQLSFTKDRAVVVSFADVVEQAVASPRTFDDLLWELYLGGDLDPDDVVIWVLRRAASGTVLVNRKGGVDVEVSADPAALGGGISFEGLALGVKFGAGSSASFQLSGPDLAVGAKVKGLNKAGEDVESRRAFLDLGGASLPDYLGTDVPEVSADSILAGADFSQGEDEG
jgi:hypothetical protein